MKLKQFDIVHVRWADHNSFKYASWHQLEEFDDSGPMYVDSVGYVLKETPEVLVLAAHCAFELDNYLGDMVILKDAIKSIKILSKNVRKKK